MRILVEFFKIQTNTRYYESVRVVYTNTADIHLNVNSFKMIHIENLFSI